MYFLNNIWNFFISANTVNTKLITMPFAFLEFYLSITLVLYIFNIEISKKQKTLYVILTAIISILSISLIGSPFNIIINFVLFFVIAIIILKFSYFHALISTIMSFALYGLIGSLVINPYLTIFNISSYTLENTPIYKIMYLLITYLFAFLIILFVKNKNLKLIIFSNINKRNRNIMLLNLILGILTLGIQAFITFYYIDRLPIVVTFSSFLVLLAYLSISFFSLTRVMKLTQTTQKLESAEEYNKSLCVLYDGVRGFKHDFDNIVSTIDGYIRDNDMGRLKKYFSQLSNECQRLNNLYILNPNIINNPGLYNLLTSKYHESDSKDIKFNVTCLLDLNAINMKIYEFARILGILLDNAIEASEECEEKVVNIIFRDDDKHHRQLVTIENTYNNRDVDTIKIFEKNVSGKDNHSGIGLWEVNKILNKNKNVSLFTSKGDKYFSQQLEIYYK